ncbi:SPFH domain-containing protein [Sediminispirochaeta bajacaliforniensis]|uniref:hypothetical protein n=1 Tax=Sediminispirochaeta bajacaliforniensis TaxID=148 RepID=UPI00037B5589|nr:hypothetical protein [Sediminispirochaeta bajacaliforniensis]
MKKILVVFILLLILGGVVFYFGWIQNLIPENHYAVLFTKTSGYAPNVYKPGVFYWEAERLIPGNMKLHLFDLTPRNRSIESSGTLPSGKLYAGILPDEVSFDYTIKLSLSYRIRPEELPHLVKDEGLTQETLNDWYTAREAKVLDAASAYLAQHPDRIGIDEDLSSSFPELEFSNISILSWHFPDKELYEMAKKLYFDRLSTTEAAEREALSKERLWSVSRKERLAVLEEYGRLLSTYPGLLKLVLSRAEDPNLISIEDLLSETPDE